MTFFGLRLKMRTAIYYLKGFPLNSRHPSPQREEGGLRAAVHMPLFVDAGDCAENSGQLDSVCLRSTLDTFA